VYTCPAWAAVVAPNASAMAAESPRALRARPDGPVGKRVPVESVLVIGRYSFK
jgi:hypothetical protein